jgi:hypothetical protein
MDLPGFRTDGTKAQDQGWWIADDIGEAVGYRIALAMQGSPARLTIAER